ncbi:MAG: hypothetical protein PHG65_13295, partial [Kiritimatiellae bacterium]|nr:hypothetical protein [Kiritimatiellia bacterium]
FFRFPPVLTGSGETLEFSWPFYLMFCVLFGLALAALAGPENFGFRPRKQKGSSVEGAVSTGKNRLPAWGRLGGWLMGVSWCLAWGRFEWMGSLRDYLFFPLWVGCIFFMDGLVYRRRRTSLFSQARRGFWMLFPMSALLWWYFEYLNRFVRNWWYEGQEGWSAFQYVIYGTLCFSTVLPAVFECCSLVLSFDYVKRSFSVGPVRPKRSDIYSFSCMCAGILGLFLAGLFPQVFFPLIWVAPLAIAVGTLGFCRVASPFRLLQRGHYVLPVALMFATLLCGLLWELWNMYSLPQWHYSIPYLTKFRIFEMPLPGYSGYLPFGLVCWTGWLMLAHLLPSSWAARADAVRHYLEESAQDETDLSDGKQEP